MPTAQLAQCQREVENLGFDPGPILQGDPCCELCLQCGALALHPRDDRLHLAPALGGALGVTIRRGDHTMKLSPQPQAPLALGFSNTKPALKSSSRQSITLPMR